MFSTMISAALAGSLARIPVHPFDTIKARLMASSKKVSLLEVIKLTYKTEGIKGFYRGFWFTFFTSIPASTLYFSTQEFSRPYFKNSFFSGFFAEIIACILYVPIDVIKERLQVSTSNNNNNNNNNRNETYNKGGIKALKYIVQKEGIRNGLYKGYFITILSFGPFSGLYFYFYEMYRLYVLERLYSSKTSVPSHMFWLGGGLSGAIASWLTTPLDLLKLRMQLDPTLSPPTTLVVNGKSPLFENMRYLYVTQGIRGSFQGALARVLFFAPTTAFSMALFETFKSHELFA